MNKEWEHVARLILDLRKVTKWGHMHSFAKSNGLPNARTWDPFTEKLEEECQLVKRCKEVRDLLQSFYLDQLIGGNRVLQILNVSDGEKATLHKRVSSIVVPKTPGSDAYPHLVDEKNIAELPAQPTLVGKRQLADGSVALSFMSVRFIEERKKYRPDEVTEAVRKAFSGYDHFIAIKHTYKQCADAIIVPADAQRVELRLDLPTVTNMEYAAICAVQVLEQFHNLFPSAGGASVLAGRINFFPAIDRIYRKRGLGQVVELGFETSTNSVKVEKMRDRDSDLRDELYHKTGKAAIKSLVPFKLAVKFQLDRSGAAPELLLPGNFRELNRSPPALDLAVLEGCLTEKHVAALIRTLIENV
jgi:hypothetical protein